MVQALFIFLSTDNALARAETYTAFSRHSGLFELGSPFFVDHAVILGIGRNVPRRMLAKFIADFEANPNKEIYTIKPGLFRKEMAFSGQQMRKLLPKLKSLLKA